MSSPFETEATRPIRRTNEEQTAVALTSIAISIKRIADAIEGVPYDHAPGADNSKHRLGIVDAISLAIEAGIRGARR